MSEMIRTESLKKYFKTPDGMLHAVDNIDIRIEKGKTLGVVGESGCGKSTLGRTILGLTEASSGKVFFEGEEITGINRRRKREMCRNMQIIFQDPFSSLNPRMCVYDLIAAPLRYHNVCRGNAEIAERVKELCDIVGIAERHTYSYPHELDGGRRQRVGVARALALNPKFIVCDEPVSALDVSIQAQILNLLIDLQKQRELTYMFITHDLSVVRYISDDILVMYLGCMVEKAPSDKLFEHQLHPYTKGLLSAIPLPDIHIKRERVILSGELSSPIDPGDCCRFHARCPYAKDICRKQSPALEEVMPEHYVACHLVREINQLET